MIVGRPCERCPVSCAPACSSAAIANGSGHMSFVSKIIGTAERVPLPDLVIRAAVQRLCSRTATRLPAGDAEGDTLFAAEMPALASAGHHDRAQAPPPARPAAPC